MIKLQKGESMKYKINVIESKCGGWMFAPHLGINSLEVNWLIEQSGEK